jgi:hypothetical protein
MEKSVRAKATDGFIVRVHLLPKCQSSSSVIILALESAEWLMVNRIRVEQILLLTLGIAEVVVGSNNSIRFAYQVWQ